MYTAMMDTESQRNLKAKRGDIRLKRAICGANIKKLLELFQWNCWIYRTKRNETKKRKYTHYIIIFFSDWDNIIIHTHTKCAEMENRPVTKSKTEKIRNWFSLIQTRDSFLFVLFNTQKKFGEKKTKKIEERIILLFSLICPFGKQFVNNVLIQRKLIDFSVDWLCYLLFTSCVCYIFFFVLCIHLTRTRETHLYRLICVIFFSY